MLQRLLAALLGPAPEPESVVLLRRLGRQLTDMAGELRQTAARARLLDGRLGGLRIEALAWERRLDRAKRHGDREILIAAAKMSGRVQGELEAARSELGRLLDEEIALRDTLVTQRAGWLRMLAEAQRLGHDVSGCMTEIDLQSPPPADSDLPDDEEREYVARVIDGMTVH